MDSVCIEHATGNPGQALGHPAVCNQMVRSYRGREMRFGMLMRLLLVLGICRWTTAAELIAPIDSDSAAMAQADRYTGIERFYEEEAIERPPAVSRIATYRDSTTLNLHEALNGRRAWKISYPEFQAVLCSVSGCHGLTPQQKTCDIWIDSATGQLLLADIRPSDSTWIPQRPCERGVAFALSFRGKTYLGLPDVMPAYQMTSVLAKCWDFLVHGNEAILQYVMMPDGQEAAPYWVAYMMDVGFANTSPDDARQVIATVVIMNALTGDSPPLGTTHYTIGSFDDTTALSRQIDSATNELRKRYEDHFDD